MSGVGDPNSAVGAALSQRVVWPGVPNKRINLARPSAASKRRVTLAAEPAQAMRGALGIHSPMSSRSLRAVLQLRIVICW